MGSYPSLLMVSNSALNIIYREYILQTRLNLSHEFIMTGYVGWLCEVNINECIDSPCKNGGSCVDLVNGYQCLCVSGYTGNDCNIEIDECVPQPCLNNATCQDLINE